jgi:hypothetical protein
MYATLAELKRYANITESTDDTILTECIVRAQAIIERACGRVFEVVDGYAATVRTFDAVENTDGRVLHIDADLCGITNIRNGDGTTILPRDYTVQPRNEPPFYAIRLLTSSGLNWTYIDDPEDAIEVTGYWAYSTTAPDDIVQATIRLSAFLYRQRDTSADLDRPILTGESMILPSALPADVREIVKRYVRLA